MTPPLYIPYEWRCQSRKDHPEDGGHLQRLAQGSSIYRAYVSYHCTRFNRGNPFSLSARHGGNTSHGGQDPVNDNSDEYSSAITLATLDR